jgi:hypothetical protein
VPRIIFYATLVFHLLFTNSYAKNSFEIYGSVVKKDLNPPVGIPLAGYGDKRRRLSPIDWRFKIPHSTFFKPSEGVHDPIHAKVMVLENRDALGRLKPNGRVIFVSMDVIGVTWRFVRKLARKLKPYGIKRKELIVTGTHTHSGPGTLTKNLPLSFVAVDLYKRKNFNLILNRTVESIVEALNNIEPIELYTTNFYAKDIQVNKFRHKGEGWFDNEAKLLIAINQENKVLGGLFNFAMHGNAMPIDYLHYSGDMPTALASGYEDALMEYFKQDQRPTLLFMNGAEGDVAHKGGRKISILNEFRDELKKQALTHLKTSKLKAVTPKINNIQYKMHVNWPTFPLKTCAKRDGYYGKWMDFLFLSKSGEIPIKFLFPRSAFLSGITIGDISMFTWPGEASASVGFMLKEQAKQHSHFNSWFLGLTNGYMAYFNTKEEYYIPSYDSCSNMYGDDGHKNILKTHKTIMKQLKR